jgi:hypothetical protein
MSGFERESLAAEAKLKIKAVLTVRCPTCGASRGVLCRLGTGLLRKTSHRDRRLVAKENCPSNGLPPNSRKVRRRPLRDTTTIRSILLRTHCPFPLGVSWPSPRSLLFLRSFAARTRWTRPLRAAYATKSFVRYGALAIGGGGEAQAGARSGTRDGPNPARKPRPETVAGKKCGAWPNSMRNILRAWRMFWPCMKSRSRYGNRWCVSTRNRWCSIRKFGLRYRGQGHNETEAQVAHGQRHERLQAIQQELAQLADLSRRVLSMEQRKGEHLSRLHVVQKAS